MMAGADRIESDQSIFSPRAWDQNGNAGVSRAIAR
jgi:hypothetical protein